MIQATVRHQSDTLQKLVSTGADLNLQNQVRYTVTVDTALHNVRVSFHIRRVSLLLCSRQGVGGQRSQIFS